jgi:hypothetical protein
MTTLTTISGCVIPAGESLSNAVDCTGSIHIVRIIMPDSWTGNASLSFAISPDGVNYHDLHHLTEPGDAFHSFEVQVPRPPAGAVIVMPLDYGNDVTFIKVRSGAALTPIVQETDRAFSFVCAFPDTAPVTERRVKGWAGKHGRVRIHEGVAVWPAGGRITVIPPGPTGN